MKVKNKYHTLDSLSFVIEYFLGLFSKQNIRASKYKSFHMTNCTLNQNDKFQIRSNKSKSTWIEEDFFSSSSAWSFKQRWMLSFKFCLFVQKLSLKCNAKNEKFFSKLWHFYTRKAFLPRLLFSYLLKEIINHKSKGFLL